MKHLKMLQNIYGQDANRKDIAVALGNLGNALRDGGSPDAVLIFSERSLKMLKRIHGEDAVNSEIAVCLRDVAAIHEEMGLLHNFAKPEETLPRIS